MSILNKFEITVGKVHFQCYGLIQAKMSGRKEYSNIGPVEGILEADVHNKKFLVDGFRNCNALLQVL